MGDAATLSDMEIEKAWPGADFSRVPSAVYTDSDIYQRELDRIFYGPHWSYVGLDVSGRSS